MTREGNGDFDERRYDAFLSHNSADKPRVRQIGRWLADEADLEVFLDEWNLVPGDPWQEGLERALDRSRCCVVFLGPHGLGAWQNEEMRVALDQRVTHGTLRVVPALLPDATRPDRESELPPFLRRLTWVRFEDDWNEEESLRRLAAGIRGEEPGIPTVDVEPVDVACPYRGLEAFRAEDRRFFFGREAVVQRLHEHLRERRFLAVVGPSGSGKSSVVQAGLAPRLAGDGALVTTMTPREHPLEELAFALRRSYPAHQAPPSDELLSRLDPSDASLHFLARELLEATGARRFVLVVDQLEELFTQTVDEAERARCLARLLRAVERAGPVTVILALRSDFLAHCTSHPDLNVFVTEHLEQLGPMSRDELRSAVVRPGRLAGLSFEDGLVDEILDDVTGSAGELPLLQHALLELHDQRAGNRLTLEAYRRVGRIAGALTRRAEAEYARLGEVEKATLRKMFVLCLVKAGEGTEDTRRRASREELLAVGDDPRVAETLLTQWTEARLLTTRGEDGRPPQVDVAHEALIRNWDRVQDWMAEDREEARLVDNLRQAAKEWQRSGRRPDYLLRGARLAQAREVIGRHGTDLSKLERSFVTASSRAAQRLRRLVAAAVILALGVTGYLLHQFTEHSRESRLQRSSNLWSESQTARKSGRTLLTLHLVSEAVAVNPTVATVQLIDWSQFQPNSLLRQSLEHQGQIRGALFNGDESRVLTWSEDSTARLWHGDESRVLTRSEDSTARLWDLAKGKPIGPALRHQDAILGARFNGDETRILTWSRDATVQLWDAGTGEAIGPLLQHQGAVRGATFNRDETRILTWSDDNTTRLWNATTGEPTGSPFQGQVLATSNVDGDPILTSSLEDPTRLQGGLAAVFQGHRVLGGDADSTAQLWNTARSQSTWSRWLLELLCNDAEDRILTWKAGNTAQLWKTATGQAIGPPLQHQSWVVGATFNSDGARILTWSADNTARMWNATTGEAVGPPLQHQCLVVGAMFNGDETRILTWSADATAQLWSTATGRAVGPSLQHQGPVLGATFNGDETRILTWSADNTARLWDAATGQAIGLPLRHQDAVKGASFRFDETRILTWSADGTARLWEADSCEEIGPAFQHDGEVTGARFTRDGNHIVTWSEDSVRLWVAASGASIQPRFTLSRIQLLTWGRDKPDLEADLDFPTASAVLQTQATTGTELDPSTHEVEVLEPDRWREIERQWQRVARAHYKVCEYPRYNLWRRFHVEEADRIRPLD